MTMATVLETLIERPRSARAREVSISAAETELQARAADICEQYRVTSSANDVQSAQKANDSTLRMRMSISFQSADTTGWFKSASDEKP